MNSIVEEPDLNVLEPRFFADENQYSSVEEYYEAIKKYENRYKEANWWLWNSDQWKDYLNRKQFPEIETKDKVQKLGYETILVTYGQWAIDHPNASDTDKLGRIQDITLAYILFWQYGEETPSSLARLEKGNRDVLDE